MTDFVGLDCSISSIIRNRTAEGKHTKNEDVPQRPICRSLKSSIRMQKNITQ